MARPKPLTTIQTKEVLNLVYPEGPIGPGGAQHIYTIKRADTKIVLARLFYQKGPRHSHSSHHGILDQDLLEIVRHRLQCFQEGPLNSSQTERALVLVTSALQILNERVEERIQRGVLGTDQP